jgi:diguanylate cyclase (GGDEF)-like protein
LGLIFADGRSARRYLADTLDAALFALGAFLVLWLFLLYGRPGQAGADFVTAFGRPIGVALLAGVLFRLIFVVERQTASFRLLVAATTFTLAGGVLRIGAAVGHPYVHRVDDVGALGAGYTVLIAAALVHPDSAVPVPTRQAGIARFSTPRTVVFVLLALLGPLAWAVAVIPGGFEPRSVLEFGVPVMIAALITLLVLWRMALINRFADNRADQLQALHSELVYRATHDQLTHLVNRAELVNHLEALLRGGHVGNARSALLMLDLDGFKGINDSFGHPVGDQLLVDVAARLTTVSASSDTVARLGGDEFAVLLADADEPTARSIANLIRHRLGEPYRTSGRTLSVSASVGVCVIPRVDQSSSEVLRDADLALYAAKAAGKDSVRVFDERIKTTYGRQAR